MTLCKSEFECSFRPSVDQALLETVAFDLRMPASAKEMYGFFNGLSSNWVSVLPVENPANIKRTWNGIRRANAPRTVGPHRSTFLEADVYLMERFFVFADIGEGKCAVIERATEQIWWEDGNELVQMTNVTLDEFIEFCLKEADEC